MKHLELTLQEAAYIAGFLDGDGSLFAQIVKGDGYKYGYYIRISMVFYQKTGKYWFMLWLKKLLRYGNIRKKHDGMCEYTISSSDAIKRILLLLLPYLKLKKALAQDILVIIHRRKEISTLEEFKEVCQLVDKTADLTYSKTRKITSSTIFPVETV